MRISLGLALGIALVAPAVRAQTPPNYDFQWSTITHAGNRGASRDEIGYDGYNPGSVDHEYRIAKTEVTVGQWVDFLNAYSPYITVSHDDYWLTGPWARWNGSSYIAPTGTADLPTSSTWRYGAVFCNWLANGKGTTAGAFSNGAYDTTTFTSNPDGTTNDQLAHNSGATFWIPTRDEWVKAAFYDPNRYGTGVEGYWKFIGGGDDILLSGLPGEGGQTSAGWNIPSDIDALAVGLYPAVGPWGLFDQSGGVEEWTETDTGTPNGRFTLGSWTRDAWYPFDDALNYGGHSATTYFDLMGFRFASSIPSPSGPVIIATLLLLRKRTR